MLFFFTGYASIALKRMGFRSITLRAGLQQGQQARLLE
jgi:hypothetical protein